MIVRQMAIVTMEKECARMESVDANQAGNYMTALVIFLLKNLQQTIIIKSRKRSLQIIKAVAALGFQIHGVQTIFSLKVKGEYNLKIEKKTKSSLFTYFIEEFMIQTFCFIAYA